jgi:hypothetical protein
VPAVSFKNWFYKVLYIRLADEGDGFVSTACYSVAHPKGLSLRFKKKMRFVMADNLIQNEDQSRSCVALISDRRVSRPPEDVG